MYVLFTCVGYTGHFHPLVPFARVLSEAGHQVAFATSLNLKSQVEASGFHFFPAGANPSEVIATMPELQGLDPLARRDVLRKHLFPELLPQRLLPDLIKLCAEIKPDLIICDNNEFAGRVVAESRGIRHAVIKAAHAYHYDTRHLLVPAMDALRLRVGLPSDPEAQMLFRYLYIVTEPLSLRANNPQFLPPTAVHLQHVIFDQSGDETLPEWINQLYPQPTVFVTLGTVVNKMPDQLEKVLLALANEPLNLIVTVGRDRNPADFGKQPDNVHLERYIPQSQIFPFCDLVVSHCGSSTMVAALDYGLPMVNLPITADQPENAEDCAKAGVGLTVTYTERTTETILAATRKALADPSYRGNARQIQKEMQTLPGLEVALKLFEDLGQISGN